MRHDLAGARQGDADIVGFRLREPSLHRDGPSGEVIGTLNLDVFEVNGTPRFEPRRLPDSALDPVPVLLARERAAEAAAIPVVGRAGIDSQNE